MLLKTKKLVNIFIFMCVIMVGKNLMANSVNFNGQNVDKVVKVLTLGVLTTYKISDNVTIHQYLSNENARVNSYIIETKNALVLVDSQATVENAEEVKTFALSLNKKIDRIIITHAHRDHYMGLSVFADSYPVYALSGTIDAMKENGFTGAEPKNIIEENKSFVVDGITYNAMNIKNAHIANHLVLLLDPIGVMIIGDLAFDNRQLLIVNFDDFEKGLKVLDSHSTAYKIALPGHGQVFGSNKIKTNLKYILDAKEVLKNTKNTADYVKEITELYKDLDGATGELQKALLIKMGYFKE